MLITALDQDANPWKHSSFNGHCMSKTFGVKTEFYGKDRHVRQIDPANNLSEHAIPPYINFLFDRLKLLPPLFAAQSKLSAELAKFAPNEFNANSYVKAQGHFLSRHVDDRQLSGPLLANLSLGSQVAMRYCLEKDLTKVVDVTLPRRTLQIIAGKARFDWAHEIPNNLMENSRRVSITMRQSGAKFGVEIRAPVSSKASRK